MQMDLPKSFDSTDVCLPDACVLPIYDEVESDERSLQALERFRILLSTFPVLMPIVAFASYDVVEGGFHNFIALARTWYAVDGGTAEITLITPVINGVIQPGVAIVLGTLIASTLNSLRSRQVAIRACLNKEACDIRMLDATINSIFSGDANDVRRRTLLNALRQYVNRIIIESRARSTGSEISSGTESELDGIQRMLFDKNRGFDKVIP